jgi:MSHA biogenesis protein MshM
MYQAYFGLRERPFGITPDTEFLCATRSHQAALNTLLIALAGGEGFVKITGEVGTGKTVLCRHLLHTLREKAITAYLPSPNLEPHTLLLAILQELSIQAESKAEEFILLRQLNTALLNHARENKQVIICIDEAQAMPIETLESLRLLSNLETEKRKLLQVVLFGQPELNEKLSAPNIRQLRQRIAFSETLEGLELNELGPYLHHRLHIAGYEGPPLFSEPVIIKSLYQASRGIPRLVNILAHKSLMVCFGRGGRMIELSDIDRAVQDTDGLLPLESPSWLSSKWHYLLDRAENIIHTLRGPIKDKNKP